MAKITAGRLFGFSNPLKDFKSTMQGDIADQIGMAPKSAAARQAADEEEKQRAMNAARSTTSSTRVSTILSDESKLGG